MRSHLLSLTALLAAAAIPAAPAAAQTLSGAGFTAGSAFHSKGHSVGSGDFTGVRVHRGGDRHHGQRHHGRRGDRDFGGFYVGPRDGYDLNRGWASDSYNDWWHDRPDRAFPRWMSANQDCQRQWWSGGGWRC